MISLVWHDMRSEIPLAPREAREAWDAWWDQPLGGPQDDVDTSVLDALINMGQARDHDDARLLLAHQEKLAQITDPIARANANNDFALARRARYQTG